MPLIIKRTEGQDLIVEKMTPGQYRLYQTVLAWKRSGDWKLARTYINNRSRRIKKRLKVTAPRKIGRRFW